MHDGLAASLTVTKQYLAGNLGEIDIAVVLHEWEKSIAFRDAVLLSEKEKLFDNASSSGVSIQIKGEEPTGSAAELTYVAMQVCLNNAIQYAKATKLSVSIQKNEDKYSVVIRNNGKPPEKVITEGGGLTNLRCRIENSGGIMTVYSLPEFSLVMDLPKTDNAEEGGRDSSEKNINC